MNSIAAFALVALLRASPAVQAQDTTPPDTAKPLGPRVVISQSLLLSAPIDDPREALTLLPGIVRRGTALGIGAGSGLAFRDGVPGRASVYINGAPAQLWNSDSPGLTLAADAIDHIAITTGIAPADVADAQGGAVIMYTTPSGGARLAGHLSAHTDGIFGSGSSVGYNRFAGSAGGPLGQRLTWFVSGELTGQGSAYRGAGASAVPAYTMGAIDTVAYGVPIPGFDRSRGLELPLDWLTERRAQGKITFHYSAGSSLSFTALLSNDQQRFYPGTGLADTALYEGRRSTSRLGILNWVHSLGGASDAAALHAVVSFAHDEAVSGPLTAATEQATRSPALGIAWTTLAFTGSDVIAAPVTDQLVRNIRTNSGVRVPFFNRTDLRTLQLYRFNPYGAAMGWPTQGLAGTLSLATSSHATARLWLGWHPAPAHTSEVGIDYERGTETSYQGAMLSEINLDAWRALPRRIGAFAEDNVRIRRLALDIGVRFDHYTPGGLLPFTPGRIFSNPAWSSNAAVSDTAYAASLLRVMAPTRSPSALSPRAGAMYSLSSSIALRARYGQMVEAPTAAQTFGGSNTDGSFASLLAVPFGRDVSFLKSSQIDVGLLAHVGPGVDIDVTAFHQREAYYVYLLKSFDDPANPGRTFFVNTLTAVDSIHANGFDVAARVQNHTLNGSLAYSLTHAAGVTTQSVAALVTVTSPARRGALRDLSVTVMGHAESGLPYLPLVNSGLGILALDESGLFGVSASGPFTRLPWTKVIDLRVGRAVHAAGLSGRVYVDLRNLLDFHNLLNAFAETGTAVNDLYQANVLSPEFSNLHVEAADNGVLLSGNAVDLRPDCATWTANTAGPVDCIALRRVERRFGNGDGVYDLNEQTRALSAYYEAFAGTWAFHAPGRTARIGVELTF